MPRRLMYGWQDDRGYFVSRYPPDAPVRPAVCLENLEEVNDMLKRQRADVMWIPPLKTHHPKKGI